MSKELKKLIVNELISNYRDKNNIVVVDYKGIKAHQANALRSTLSEKEITLKVVKNSLAALAFKEVGIAELGQMLEGASAVTTSSSDPVFLAKVLTTCSKENPEFKIRGGVVDGKLLSSDDIKALATIPSREVVLAQILMGISTPLVQLSKVFNATIRDLYLVLVAIREEKEA